MRVIILRSVASINSGAMIYRLASSAVSGGRPELETELAEAAGARVPDAVVAAADCACERVCSEVACKLAGCVAPEAAKTGLRGDGESNEWATSNRERQYRA
eukprot:5844690-Pleurochrysis_carterae.AAC.1